MRLLADTVVWIRPPITDGEYEEQLDRHHRCTNYRSSWDDVELPKCARCGGPMLVDEHYMAYGRNVCIPCGDLLMTLKALAG